MTENRELVIVGAGWHGLAAAKIYLDLYPDGDLLVLDANSSIGGVWATDNFYPALRTQNTLGSFEFSWYPLTTAEFGVQAGQHIPGQVVQKYLQRVADKFGIASRLRFRTKVVSATPDANGGWLLETEGPTGAHSISCAKLILATGVTSAPKILRIPGSEVFKGPLVGYKELSDPEKSIFITDPSIETVTVIGGSKSGHDAVFWSARAGKKVNWVVQRSGYGVFWMTCANTRFFGQKFIVERMATTRLFSLFSPCIWGDADGYSWPRWFLHRTWLGQLLVGLFWNIMGASILAATKLDLPGRTEKARPDFDFQWQASSAGTLNYDGDFYSFIRSGQVSIYRENLTTLSQDQVHLSDGTQLQTDALVYCAGWKWTSPIRFNGISNLDLGIPTRIDDAKHMQQWKAQCKRSDAQILNVFPYLRTAPPGPAKSASNEFGADEDGVQYTSWCLYRAIAPPCQAGEKAARNLAFLGYFGTLPKAALSEIQALWAIAFLHDRIKLPRTVEEGKESAILWTRWSRLRYPFSHASKFMDTSFDVVPYFDVLLSDLGLKSRRKGGVWSELWEPYDSPDYKELVEEFKKRYN
ncbi:hypothetical protein AA313_de0208425 [Arthrobotrys entomopaga]|nr:hypothetical protein AA313_de0208425 [Arthrobotrys entomopaga]